MQIVLLVILIGVNDCGNTEHNELESIVHNILVASGPWSWILQS